MWALAPHLYEEEPCKLDFFEYTHKAQGASAEIAPVLLGRRIPGRETSRGGWLGPWGEVGRHGLEVGDLRGRNPLKVRVVSRSPGLRAAGRGAPKPLLHLGVVRVGGGCGALLVGPHGLGRGVAGPLQPQVPGRLQGQPNGL